MIALLLFNVGKRQNKTYTEADIHIIPKPAEIEVNSGVFEFSEATLFVVENDLQETLSNTLIKKFESATGWQLKITDKVPNSNYIVFKTDESLNKEAYTLEVTSKQITITAKALAGFVYGLESIRQLLPVEIESQTVVSDVAWEIPNVVINDEPRFQWRGLMLDVSRHFFKADYIKQTIDRLAMHKMNVLHLHLVDDQGWRIEIKKYPKLTEVGAWRVDQEDVIWNARLEVSPDEKGTYGGFLTQEELKDIVAYAQLKNVEVIPEIEMPAHVSSAIAAYPELSCSGKPIGVPSGGVWPITDIYCAGKDSVFKFLEDVLDEVIEIFPSKYIHIGGDEATKTAWETCPYCQKRMRKEGLKNMEELQSYFVKRMEKYINSKGKKLIGWDEILEGGLAPDATVMSWRGVKGGMEAAEQGHDVVMTPGTHCYFDHYQGPQNEEPLAFGGFTPLSKVYEFDPVVDSMTVEEAKHVLGGQANLWSEYIPTTDQSEYMIFPRLAALSETVWSPKALRNWDDFSVRIESLFKRYDHLDINYAKSAFLVTSDKTMDIDKKEIQISLKNEFPKADIRYVLGDKSINDNAISYTDTVKMNKTTLIKASLFKDDVPVGRTFTDMVIFHKAVGRPVSYKTPYHDNYKGAEAVGMVNVIRGTKNFHDGQWQAWLVDDMEVVIDLEQDDTIKQVIVGTLENQGSGIYFPVKVEVLVSNDGKVFTEVGQVERPFAINAMAELKDFKIEFNPQKARFVKVIATNLKKTPKGGDSWVFVDEILVQ